MQFYTPQRDRMQAMMRGVAEAMVTGSNPAEAEGGSILSKVRDLVRRGASIDNARALHYASGTEEALELMVELPHLGGNPNQPDELGNTALHVAAVKGSPSAIKLLTLVGAGRTARDAEGRAPPPPGRCCGSLRAIPTLPSLLGWAIASARSIGSRSWNPCRPCSRRTGKTALYDGIVPPRMPVYLEAAALARVNIMQDYLKLAFLPPTVVGGARSVVVTNVIPGMQQVYRAAASLLAVHQAPTVEKVRAKALEAEPCAAKVQRMLQSGAMFEHCLDGIFQNAEEAVQNPGEGTIDIEYYAEAIASLPEHPLDWSFTIAF